MSGGGGCGVVVEGGEGGGGWWEGGGEVEYSGGACVCVRILTTILMTTVTVATRAVEPRVMARPREKPSRRNSSSPFSLRLLEMAAMPVWWKEQHSAKEWCVRE